MRRLGLVLAVALAGLALPSAAPAQNALTPSQFAAIDAVYAAFAAFEDADGATAADRAAARRACTALGSSDRMLAALRRACHAQLTIGQALGATARCGSRRSCLLAVRSARRAFGVYLTLARAANRAVAAARLAAGCERELTRTMAELLYVTRNRNAFALLERALRIRSGRLARRAQRRLDAIDPPDSRTDTSQHEDYRTVCAPSG
jgi:hypothetical protein